MGVKEDFQRKSIGLGVILELGGLSKEMYRVRDDFGVREDFKGNL